jgi:hypothetical protein
VYSCIKDGILLTIVIYTEVGKNNGNTTDTIYIFLLIWFGPLFAFNTAAILLGINSYKF